METLLESENLRSSAEDGENQSCVMGTSESSGKMCTGNRTRAWVIDDTEGSENQGFLDDCDPELRHSSQGQGKVSDLDQSEGVDPFGCSGQASDIEVEPLCDNPDVQTETGSASSNANKQAQAPTDTQGVRTSAGRVVKKVGRLIESLAQRPFHV